MYVYLTCVCIRVDPPQGAAAIEPALKTFREHEFGIMSELNKVRATGIKVDSRGSKTDVSQKVKKVFTAADLGRQAYLEARTKGRPAPFYMQQRWTPSDDINACRGRFSDRIAGQGDYCPVCWKLHQMLVLCEDRHDCMRVVDYKGKLYTADKREVLPHIKCGALPAYVPVYVRP